MTLNSCNKCGKEMVIKNRKDGTGQFLGCSGYPDCKNIVSLDKQTFNSPSMQKEKAPDWDKIRDEKADSIYWMNAKNNAGLAYANGKITKEQIETFANWFNNLEPESKNKPF